MAKELVPLENNYFENLYTDKHCQVFATCEQYGEGVFALFHEWGDKNIDVLRGLLSDRVELVEGRTRYSLRVKLSSGKVVQITPFNVVPILSQAEIDELDGEIDRSYDDWVDDFVSASSRTLSSYETAHPDDEMAIDKAFSTFPDKHYYDIGWTAKQAAKVFAEHVKVLLKKEQNSAK